MSHATRRPLLSALLLASLAACGDSPDAGDASSGGLSQVELLRVRERAAAHATEGQWAEVAGALAPAVEADDAATDDLLWAAIARWELLPGTSQVDQELAAARALLARITARDPDHPGAAWVSAQLALAYDLDAAAAAEHARTVLATHPEDAHTLLFLGRCHQELGELDEARARYEQVREIAEQSEPGLWAVATYKLGQLLVRSGDATAGMELINAQSDVDKPSDKTLDRGSLAVIEWPEHEPVREPDGGDAVVRWGLGSTVALNHTTSLRAEEITGDGRVDLVGFDAAGASVAIATEDGGFAVHDVFERNGALHDVALADTDGDRRPELVSLSSLPLQPSPLSDGIVEVETVAGSLGVQRLEHGDDLDWLALSGPFTRVLAVDFDHEGDLDLLLYGTSGAVLLRNDGGTWSDATPTALADLGPVSQVVLEDVDGDNDVDLVVVADGVSVLSSLRGGRFADVTDRWLPTGLDAERVWLADVNADRHPDLLALAGDAASLWLFRPGDELVAESTLAGRFEAAGTSAELLRDADPDAVLLADLDADGLMDLHSGTAIHDGPLARWFQADAPAAQPLAGLPPVRDALVYDLHDDGRAEYIAATADGLAIWQREDVRGSTPGITLHLEALKDNARGYGSIVEVRAGDVYSRTYIRAGRTTLGLRGATSADIVRIVWPNGVAQHLFDVPAGRESARQPDRASGSCPFLYVFDGERWRFVTDVLGATPLGLPMTPDQMVPFDHEEYVKIDGPMLRPDADGMLRVALTEELREVTYLDRVRLHAIDHPSDVEIQPDEGFVFPPFPEHHVHTIARALAPTTAVANLAADGAHGYGSTNRTDVPDVIPVAPLVAPDGSRAVHPALLDATTVTSGDDGAHTGHRRSLDATPVAHAAAHVEHDVHVWDAAAPCDWADVPEDVTVDASRLAGPTFDAAVAATPAPVVDVAPWVAQADTRCPRPFRLAPPQLQGLTEPWSLDLEFGATDAERQAIRDAPQLRLALTGWLQWGDASVNMAAARDPDHAFVPPILWVPDGADGWRPMGPPVGFPAGKTKTLVVDLTEHLDRDDPRIRITTTLELSWDRILLAVDDDDAPFVDTPMEPAGAELAFRGLSGLVCTGRDDLPEVFDWDVLSPNVPWDAHPGRYTAYGDIAPLLGAVDDEYALLGTGDVAHVSFDASALPELPAGWTRDWLLYLDGWAKDRDPNTLAAERVEPLPFHGMSAYPPSAEEIAADREARAAWDAKWNTRDGRRLLPDLRPR